MVGNVRVSVQGGPFARAAIRLDDGRLSRYPSWEGLDDGIVYPHLATPTKTYAQAANDSFLYFKEHMCEYEVGLSQPIRNLSGISQDIKHAFAECAANDNDDVRNMYEYYRVDEAVVVGFLNELASLST